MSNINLMMSPIIIITKHFNTIVAYFTTPSASISRPYFSVCRGHAKDNMNTNKQTKTARHIQTIASQTLTHTYTHTHTHTYTKAPVLCSISNRTPHHPDPNHHLGNYPTLTYTNYHANAKFEPLILANPRMKPTA